MDVASCMIVARGALLAVRDARDVHMVEQLRDGSGAVEEVRLRADRGSERHMRGLNTSMPHVL